MNPWKPLILLLVLGSLGTVAYWDHFHRKPDSEDAEKAENAILDIKGKKIEKIRLVDGTRAFTFECADMAKSLCKVGDRSSWKIVEPLELKADRQRINALVRELDRLTSTETLKAKEEGSEDTVDEAAFMSHFGLGPASLQSPGFKRVEVWLEGGIPQRVYVGNEHPFAGKIYLANERKGRPDQSRVYVASKSFTNHFEREIDHWRDKSVLDFPAHDIETFALKNKHGLFKGSKKDGKWILSARSTKGVPGDQDTISAILNSASSLKAKGFASESYQDATGKRTLRAAKQVASLKISLKDKKKKAIELVLYKKKNKEKGKPDLAYARTSQGKVLYELNTYSVGRFENSLKELRLSRLISSTERFGARRIEFKNGSGSLVLESKEGKWKSAGLDLDEKKITTFLDDLQGKRIKDFVSGKRIPKGEKKGVEVILGTSENPENRRLVFWKSKGKLFAKDPVSFPNEAYKLDAKLSKDFPWNKETFAKSNAAPQTTSKN